MKTGTGKKTETETKTEIDTAAEVSTDAVHGLVDSVLVTDTVVAFETSNRKLTNSNGRLLVTAYGWLYNIYILIS